MSSDKTLETVSERTHAEYGHGAEVGIAYFTKASEQLAQVSSSETVAYQMRRFDLRYVLDFLLSAPSIWNKMGKSDWLRTFQLSSPRPSFDKLPDDTGGYADLIFLYKFVKVDGIQLLLDDPCIPVEDKSRAARYCFAHAPLFFADDLDEENLDGDYFVRIEDLEQYRERLLSEGLRLANQNPAELSGKMERAVKAYSA